MEIGKECRGRGMAMETLPLPILWPKPGSGATISQDWEVMCFLGAAFERMAFIIE